VANDWKLDNKLDQLLSQLIRKRLFYVLTANVNADLLALAHTWQGIRCGLSGEAGIRFDVLVMVIIVNFKICGIPFTKWAKPGGRQDQCQPGDPPFSATHELLKPLLLTPT